MRYNEGRGAKYGRWDANQALLSGDLNTFASYTYQNLTDIMASVVESFVGADDTETNNVHVNGLAVTISGDDLRIIAGSVVSYQGSYFNPTTGAFAFQSGTGGQPFMVVLPENATIDDFVTSAVISGMEIRGNIEIRPEVDLYREESRAFIDPNTNVVTNSTINTRGSFGAEVRLRYGNPVNSNSQAPNEEAGWVKIAELFIDNNGAQSLVEAEDWTSGADNFLKLEDQITTFTVGDIPVASTSQRGIVERATDSEFAADDTARFVNAAQVNAAIEAIRVMLQTAIDAIDTSGGLTLAGIPNASTSVRGLVERATNTEFDNDNADRYVTAAQVNPAIEAVRVALQAMINNLPSPFTLSDIPNASTSVRGLVERATNTEFTNRDSSRYVTAAQVRGAIDDLVNGAPGALDTLNEIADALNDDANAYDTLLAAINARLQRSQNLADLVNAATARTNLGLGTAATRDVGTGPNDLPDIEDADARYYRLIGTLVGRVDLTPTTYQDMLDALAAIGITLSSDYYEWVCYGWYIHKGGVSSDLTSFERVSALSRRRSNNVERLDILFANKSSSSVEPPSPTFIVLNGTNGSTLWPTILGRIAFDVYSF